MTNNLSFKSGYTAVNGIQMYYEVHGEGRPLVLIHGGGSTIQTSFGKLIPELEKNRQVIAVEMQAHGHTSDRNADLSFEEDADDIAALLIFLKIPKADFLGFSNGAQTAIEIFLRHPQIVNKLIFASAFFKREAAPPGFWKGFETATLNDMPSVLKDAFLTIHNNPEMLQNMFDKDVKRMKNFKGWTNEQISTINVPALIISSVYDVGSLEHAVEWHRLLPGSEIAVFPGAHGSYLGAIESLKNGELPRFNAVELIEEFLEK